MLAHPPWTLAEICQALSVCHAAASQPRAQDMIALGCQISPKSIALMWNAWYLNTETWGFNRFDHLRCGYSGYRTNDDHLLGVFSSTLNHRIGMMVPEDDDFSYARDDPGWRSCKRGMSWSTGQKTCWLWYHMRSRFLLHLSEFSGIL